MHASKPRSSTTHAHFAAEPAIPITRAPCIFAIWPAIEPTPLAAADTRNVSPGCGHATRKHADVGGDADVAERAEHVGELDRLGHHRDRRERVRLHDAVLLPAREVHERPAERIFLRVVGLDDHADAVRAHALPDRDARHVVAALVEPPADRRVDAEVAHLEERFTLAERGHVGLGDVEAVLRHRADRTAGENDLTIPARVHEARTVPAARILTLEAVRERGRVNELPVEVDDLTPEWMSDAMDADVDSVTVLDRHSGTTGRAHLALTGSSRAFRHRCS